MPTQMQQTEVIDLVEAPQPETPPAGGNPFGDLPHVPAAEDAPEAFKCSDPDCQNPACVAKRSAPERSPGQVLKELIDSVLAGGPCECDRCEAKRAAADAPTDPLAPIDRPALLAAAATLGDAREVYDAAGKALTALLGASDRAARPLIKATLASEDASVAFRAAEDALGGLLFGCVRANPGRPKHLCVRLGGRVCLVSRKSTGRYEVDLVTPDADLDAPA